MTASHPSAILIATCANKMLHPEVLIGEGETLAASLGCKFVQASIPPVFGAKNTGLRDEFGALVWSMCERHERDIPDLTGN